MEGMLHVNDDSEMLIRFGDGRHSDSIILRSNSIWMSIFACAVALQAILSSQTRSFGVMLTSFSHIPYPGS